MKVLVQSRSHLVAWRHGNRQQWFLIVFHGHSQMAPQTNQNWLAKQSLTLGQSVVVTHHLWQVSAYAERIQWKLRVCCQFSIMQSYISRLWLAFASVVRRWKDRYDIQQDISNRWHFTWWKKMSLMMWGKFCNVLGQTFYFFYLDVFVHWWESCACLYYKTLFYCDASYNSK